jgi:hypothetical protein
MVKRGHALVACKNLARTRASSLMPVAVCYSFVASQAVVLHQVRDQPRPACLVTGTNARAAIAVIILVERQHPCISHPHEIYYNHGYKK